MFLFLQFFFQHPCKWGARISAPCQVALPSLLPPLCFEINPVHIPNQPLVVALQESLVTPGQYVQLLKRKAKV